jgi:octaprenyl-diphosphate synthase
MSSSPVTSRTGSPNLNFASIFLRLKPHLAALDQFLREQIGAFEPEIREMADYCIDTSGKRIRPALVFLSGERSDPTAASAGLMEVSPDLVRVAAVVELVHLATLVHDDIMDGADLRRSRPTAARAYGPEAAVLLGDALFAHALHLAAQFPTTAVCLAVSDSTRKVCAGEIIQTLRRGTTNVSREDYFRVIDLKTAELFRISCQLGSQLAGYSAGFVTAAADFGRRLGVGYQIYDDLADFFGQEAKIGKTLGTDLVSGKLTLPLLVLAERLAPSERVELMDEIMGRRPPDLDLRLQQMQTADVFAAVAKTVEEELEAGELALRPYDHLAPVPLLLELAQVLRTQVASLRRN